MPTFSDIFSVIADLDDRTSQGHQEWLTDSDSPRAFNTNFQGLQVTIRRNYIDDHVTAVLKHPRGYFTHTYTPQELGGAAAATLRDLYDKARTESDPAP